MATPLSLGCLVFDFDQGCQQEQRAVLQTPDATRCANECVQSKSSGDAWLPPLPDALLVEIFARLPAKSVGRLRCMSRSWATTLTSASFVKLHLREANRHRSTPKLFFTTGHPEDPDNRWLIDKILTKPCNGLVLLRCLPGSGHYVYNPSTGVLLPLPHSDDHRWGMAMGESYGLGYSPTTKEHKVVRLFSSGCSTPCCEVFSLDVSMQWRVVPRQTPPSRVPVRVHPAVFCDGYLHFLQGRGGSNIVTFDVGDETFGLLATPPSAQDDNVPLQLTVLGRRLCMCVFRGGRGSDVDPYCIWRLACRDSRQWEKLYRVLHPQTCRPQLDLLRVPWISALDTYLAGNVQKIMFATEVGVLAFDLQGGGVPEVLVSPTEIVSTAEVAKISYSTAGLLEESLVPVGRTSEEIAFSSPWRKAWSDVLKWRPARSVASLAHVCKGWREVIESDRFARTHALNANLGKKSPRLMLVLLRPSLDTLDFYPLVFRQRMQQEMSSQQETSMSTVCSRPCHGLVLVTYMEGCSRVDFVCNPIRKYGGRVKTDPPNSPYSDGCIGLGYDLRRNEHVLARLVRPETETSSRRHQPMKCYVQLIGITPSPWIPISPPPRPPAVDTQPAYADGKLYWMVDDHDDEPASSRCELLVLDVGTREFEVLPGPPCDRDRITSIIELQGNVCIVCSDTGANAIDVWTLEGAAGSWSAWPCRIELTEFRQVYPSAETRLLAVDPSDGRVLLSTAGESIGILQPRDTGVADRILCFRRPTRYGCSGGLP